MGAGEEGLPPGILDNHVQTSRHHVTRSPPVSPPPAESTSGPLSRNRPGTRCPPPHQEVPLQKPYCLTSMPPPPGSPPRHPQMQPPQLSFCRFACQEGQGQDYTFRDHFYSSLLERFQYYSAIKKNEIELFVVRWMDRESVIQSEISQKEKNKYRMLTHTYGI